MTDHLQETIQFLRNKGIDNPEVGVVLGTGLGKFVDHLTITHSIPYEEIPHFPVATVEFHSGKLLVGTCHGKKVIVMQGRFHYYEGYSMQQITYPIRVMKLLGVKHLLLSNAAGGINLAYKKGDLVMLEDHINLQPDNPLRGASDNTLGPRFPDMNEPYDKSMRTKLAHIAQQQKVSLKEGVYVSVMGPNLETRAEYRFLGRIGADMVGMSTVPEVLVAVHMSLPCLAVSVITDECDPDNLQPVNIQEILAVAAQADAKLSGLFAELIGAL
jgi:purine-nucleoside phosphorylase